ncbi:MAG: helix-turn-helix domain-containing protein [Alphaproteobacteria bacterium]|nr:helix-turn-helix domain-containing protein [Alphaproteobacteria bacterium]
MKKTDKTKEELIEQAPKVVTETEILLENEGKVGGILKQARLRQGKNLVDIAQCLCIRRAYLEAIEESRYDVIPENPYGIGFIRSYAEYLGENSSNIVRMYKDETSTKFGDNKMYVLEPQVEATVPSRKSLLLSLLSIIAIYALWMGYNKYQNAEHTTSETLITTDTAAISENTEFPLVVEDYASAEENTDNSITAESSITDSNDTEVINVDPIEDNNNNQVVVSEGEFKEENNTNVEPVNVETNDNTSSDIPAEALSAPAKGKSNIVIQIKKETWIEVKNDKKLYLSKVLPAGTVYALPKAEGLIFSAGRVDGVEVYVGGKLVDIVKPNKKTNIILDEVLKTNTH